mgnify:CR=1 FL=1
MPRGESERQMIRMIEKNINGVVLVAWEGFLIGSC